MPAFFSTARVADASARMWSSWDWVANSGSSRLRCSGYSAIAGSVFLTVIVHIPAQISSAGLEHGGCDGREVRGYVVLKTSLANEMQEFLKLLYFNHTGPAKSVQRIIRESSFAYIPAHLARSVVGGETGKTHWLRFDQPHAGSERVLFAHCAGDDFLIVHFH